MNSKPRIKWRQAKYILNLRLNYINFKKLKKVMKVYKELYTHGVYLNHSITVKNSNEKWTLNIDVFGRVYSYFNYKPIVYETSLFKRAKEIELNLCYLNIDDYINVHKKYFEDDVCLVLDILE